ncbi:MAG: BON domain-containing protein [Alphaproteobacteria bacterium]|nr:BON domain-containing protein [Alphaproteobacteria bacterium]
MLVSFIICFTGCVPVIVGGGMVVGAHTAMKDKKVGDSINDSKIDIEVKKRLYSYDHQMFSEVSAVTNNGCVLLTGHVSNPEWIKISEQEAWKVQGVVAVDNNLVCGDISVGDILGDGFITTSCRSQLIFAGDVKSVNYKLKTCNAVVYVRGTARSKEELDRVLEILQKVRNVKKVVSYVEIAK